MAAVDDSKLAVATAGAMLIARMYPKHAEELQLLDEYHRTDGVEPLPV